MLIKNRKINLVNIALIMYIFSIIVFNEGTFILKIIKILFVGISILHMFFKKKLYIDKYIIWMIAFISFCTLSLRWSMSIDNAKAVLSTLILNDICIFFIANLIYDDKKRITLIINSIIFSSIIMGLKVAIEFGPLVFVNGSRGATGELMSANTIGMIAAIAGVFCVYKIKNEKTNKGLYIIACVLNIIILLLSASRKALLFLLIPIMIYYIFSSKNIINTLRKIIVSFIISIIAFGAIMKVPVLYNTIGNRIETMIYGFLGYGETDASTSLRLRMIAFGIEWFQEKPYLGYGINNYKTLLGKENTSFGREGVYAHNNYIELLVDIGIIGTILYYYIYITILNKGIKNSKKLSALQIVMLGIFISCIINEYGNVSYYGKFDQLILLLSWIIIYGKSKNIESDDEIGQYNK